MWVSNKFKKTCEVQHQQLVTMCRDLSTRTVMSSSHLNRRKLMWACRSSARRLFNSFGHAAAKCLSPYPYTDKIHHIRPKIFYTLTFRLPPEVFIRRMKTSFLQLVLGTVSSRCAKKTVVCMTEVVAALLTVMARCPSLRMWIASLIHLVGLSP